MAARLTNQWLWPRFKPFPPACIPRPPSRAMAAAAKVTAPYGSWKSPITADVVSGADKKLGGFGLANDGRLVWLESRPAQAGYCSIPIISSSEDTCCSSCLMFFSYILLSTNQNVVTACDYL